MCTATASWRNSEGRVVVARDDVPDNGWYVGPMLAVVDDPHARLATEEIFGPLLTAVPVPDFDAALAVANDSDYALTAGVFTRTPSHIERRPRRLDAGNVYVNRGTTGAMVARQPFGGFKLSGTGAKAGGPGYLAQFTDDRRRHREHPTPRLRPTCSCRRRGPEVLAGQVPPSGPMLAGNRNQ